MKRFTTIAAVGAAATVGAGAFALPALASGSTAGHTMHFTAVALKSADFSQTSFGQTEKDVRNGKIIGFDVINGTFHPATNSARGRVALSTRGGLLYGKLKFSNGPITRGTVTGGTGRFAGATGTIYGKSLNKNGTRTAVTIHWHR
ncbi:MAG: hypothetical protein ACXVFR_08400 [Nocardioidaceae bacterium]